MSTCLNNDNSYLNNDNSTKIYITSIPYLTPKYEHVLDFENDENKRQWFLDNHSNNYLYCNTIKDVNIEYLTIDCGIDKVNQFDYMFYQANNKYYFYFINRIEKHSDNTTILYITLDVFTTYWNDCNFYTSFIERAHVHRWRETGTPTYHIEEEGLSIGEYELKEVEDICDFENTVIIATSVPIGDVPLSTGGSMGNHSGGNWSDGIISSQGFRFIKGYEGFGKYSYTDSEGIPTIGYGVASHANPDLYNELKAQEPLSEEKAAQVMYDLITNNYGKPIVEACKTMGINQQCQFDALVSLAYNSGTGSITGNNSLMDAIASGADETTIRGIWESFKTNGGLAGLVARRKEEVDMFFGKYSKRDIVTINQDGSYGNAVTENNGDGWLPTDALEGETGDYLGHITVKNELGTFLCPVTGATISSLYGWRIHPISGTKKFHKGIDLTCPTGTDVLSAQKGTISFTGYEAGGAGNYIKVNHTDGTQTVYMHLSEILVEVNQNVDRGELIAKSGNTGGSTGPHLHWQVQTISGGSSATVDPMPDHKTKGAKV